MNFKNFLVENTKKNVIVHIVNIGERPRFLVFATISGESTDYYQQFDNFFSIDWEVEGINKEEIVGYAKIHESGKAYYGTSLFVDERYRRQGIATQMYDEVERQTGIELSPEFIHSDEGEAFWKNRKNQKG